MIFAVLIGRKGSEGFPEKIKEGIDVLNENPDYDSMITVSSYNSYSPHRARKID